MSTERAQGVIVGSGTGWLLRPLGWLLGIPYRGSRPATLCRRTADDERQRWERQIGRRRWATTLTVTQDGFSERVLPGVHLEFRRRRGGADLVGITLAGTTFAIVPIDITLDNGLSHCREATTVTVRLGHHRCRYRADLDRPAVGEVWR